MEATATIAAPQALVRLVVSDDKLSVALAAANPEAVAGITPDVALENLQQAGIFITPEVNEKLAELAASSGKIALAAPVDVCRGIKPIDDVPAHLELAPALLEKPDASKLSHYERSSIILIKEGQVLGQMRPRSEGKDGRDVFGHPIHRRKEPDHMRLGKNVEVDADGTTVRAKAAGSLQNDGRVLSVETVLEIPGNVDFSTGNIDFTGDVVIHGSIGDLFKVRGNIICVFGAAEAADVHATKNLEVHGGIIGKDKGQYSAGQNISAKYITNSSLRASDNVIVQTEIANSRILCGGRLSIEHGALIAGHVTVNGGIHCVALGSAAQVSTVVEVGFDQELLTHFEQRHAELKAQEEQIGKTHQLIDPLMRDPKNLTAAQREKATELLYEANGMETKIKAGISEIRAASMVAASKSRPEIVIAQMVHPGVTIRFPMLETRISQELRGRLKIFPKDVNGAPQIVYQPHGGSIHALETRRVRNPSLESLGRFLASTGHTALPISQPVEKAA